MDAKDTLACPNTRLNGLDDLVRGIAIVNRLFDLTIPSPRLKNWTQEVLAADTCADPDTYYGHLLCAVFDTRMDVPDGWATLLPLFKEILHPDERFNEVSTRIVDIGTCSDAMIVSEAANRFEIEHLDLLSVFEKDSFVSIKINHVYWEEFAFEGYQASGLTSIRELHINDWYRRCKLNDLVVKALRKQQHTALSAGLPAGFFSTGDFSFGVSFGNGDHPIADYLSLPLNPIHKSAVIGCLGFFQTLFPADSYVLTDGNAAKSLVWKQQCDEFFARIVAASDIIVFIVPSHLRTIRITQWQGHATNIVIPALYVHEQWPAVMPDLAGKLATIFSRFSRVSILVQAGVMSAPLGILVNLMRSDYPTTHIRYFDLGQVLDVATYPTNPKGTWVRQPWIRQLLDRTKRFPLSLDERQEKFRNLSTW